MISWIFKFKYLRALLTGYLIKIYFPSFDWVFYEWIVIVFWFTIRIFRFWNDFMNLLKYFFIIKDYLLRNKIWIIPFFRNWILLAVHLLFFIFNIFLQILNTTLHIFILQNKIFELVVYLAVLEVLSYIF